MLHMLASPPLNWWINVTQCSSSPICSDTQQPHDTSSDLLWFHRPVYKNWNSRTSNEPSAPKNRLQPGNLNNYIFPDKTKLQLSYLLHAHTHTHTRLLFLSRTFFSSNFFFFFLYIIIAKQSVCPEIGEKSVKYVESTKKWNWLR